MKHIYIAIVCIFGLVINSYAQTETYQQKKDKQLAGPSPFQKDIEGKTNRILYQDSLVTVLDGNAAVNQLPVHLLAVPNKRITGLNEMTENETWLIGHLVWVLKNEAEKMGIDSTGYRIVFNTNEDAGQSAFHIHAHLLGGAKTGAMVEQSWRNVQRVKRATTDTAYLTTTTADAFLVKMMGQWQSIDKADDVLMRCEPELGFQYMKLYYRRLFPQEKGPAKIFEGTAVYKPTGNNQYKANWYDTNGDMLPVTASVADNTLTSLWGNEQTKQGKTIYHFLDDNTLEIADFIKDKSGSWKEFGKHILKRIW